MSEDVKFELGSSWAQAGLSEEDLQAARASAAPLGERLGLADEARALAPHLWGPDVPEAWPTLQLDDIAAIPFLVNVVGVEEYQHRARVRAREGDLFAAVTEELPGYADYCRDVLGMGSCTFVQATPVGGPMEVARACSAGSALETLSETARARGGMAIHPYMGSESTWELAKTLTATAGVDVRVQAPPPGVTWLANDKSLFSELVTRVLDDEHVVETTRSSKPEELARALLGLKGRYLRAGLKRTRCASGMGNRHFAIDELGGHDEILALVRTFLEATEWDGREDVLVVAWEDTPISPSTQLWLPPICQGPPRLDGIYEQLLKGAERVFVGSRPSQLPAPVNRALARTSLLICAGLQSLGYVGRCSFDTLLLGDPAGDFTLRYTECNGRWGGTSTPMHLVDRLWSGPRPPYRAQDVQHDGLIGASFPEILEAVGDELYRPATGEGCFVFYNVNPLIRSGKLDVISVGRTQDEAEERLTDLLPRKLGLS